LPQPLSHEQQQLLKKAKRRVDNYTFHIQLVRSQTVAFREKRNNLPPGHALIIGDFSTYDLQQNVSDRHKAVLSTFVLAIDRPERRRLYVDVLCQDPATQKRDSLFVRASLMQVLAPSSTVLPDTKAVTLGTDTCAGQFRSCVSAPQFGGLKEFSHKDLCLLLHAAHHGHDLADAHVARARDAIKEYLLECEGQRGRDTETAADLLSPLTDAYGLQRVLLKYFRSPDRKHDADYDCIVLPSIDRDPALKPRARKLHGIMRLHEFQFVSATEVRTKEMSSDAEADVRHLRFEVPWDFMRGLLVYCVKLCFDADCFRITVCTGTLEHGDDQKVQESGDGGSDDRMDTRSDTGISTRSSFSRGHSLYWLEHRRTTSAASARAQTPTCQCNCGLCGIASVSA
jgi:hypothetical protein